jgi:hypothetical protein
MSERLTRADAERQVHVVTAEIGEYSDTRWWIVRAYRTEAEANRHAAALTEWVAKQNADDLAQQIDAHQRPIPRRTKRWNDRDWNKKATERVKTPPGDPRFAGYGELADPTTLRYDVEAVPVDWEQPE